MDEKHLNIKKVAITITIFIFAFLIIFGSALITSKSTKIKKDKKLFIEDSSNFTSSEEMTEAEKNTTVGNTESATENGTTESSENTIENSKETLANKVDAITNIINNNKNTDEAITENEQKLPVYNENAVELVKGIYSSDERQVFLTFDDGPSANITPQILETLEKYDVPATFFVLGSRVELYPDLVKQEYEAGHYIANHGYSHQYSSIYQSVQAVVDEYNATETAIQNALGNSDYHTYLFRFPGGSSGGPYDSLKAEAKVYLNNNGIASTNWNCLTGDAEAVGRTADQLLSELKETAGDKSSLVILMHDANDKQATADTLPQIIEYYMNEGYTFKNYYDIFK